MLKSPTDDDGYWSRCGRFVNLQTNKIAETIRSIWSCRKKMLKSARNAVMWNSLVAVIKGCKIRVKVILPEDASSDWSPWLILPSEGYGEVKGYGPFKLDDLLQLRIDPLEKRVIGDLVPNIEIDHTETLVAELRENGISSYLRDATVVIDF